MRSYGTTRSILSVRECARLQTFPDHFEFVSGHGASDAGVKQSLRGLGNARATRVGEEYRMVGNAVPPLLATRVGDAFFTRQLLASVRRRIRVDSPTVAPT